MDLTECVKAADKLIEFFERVQVGGAQRDHLRPQPAAAQSGDEVLWSSRRLRCCVPTARPAAVVHWVVGWPAAERPEG